MAVLIGRDAVIETDLSGAMVAITQVEQIALPDTKNETVDYDPLTSAIDWSEKIATSITIGDVTCTVAYDPNDTTHQTLDEHAFFVHETPFTVRVTKGGKTWTYKAIGVDADAVEFSRRDKLTRKYAFKIQGPCDEESSSSASED